MEIRKFTGQAKNCLSSSRIQLTIIGVTYFFFRTGVSMFDTIVGPYLLRAVCEKRFLNNITICGNIEQLPVIESEVRKEAGIYFIIYRLFVSVPVIFSGLFFGAWSDKRGRKIPMLVPCVGIIFSAIIYICSMYTGSLAVWIALLGTLPQSVFGNTAVAAMSVNSYVATVSDRNHRTKYISLFDGISAVGQAFGAVLAGLLKWELLISFSVVVGIQCLTALSIAVFVQEIDSTMKNEYIEHIELETGNSNCSKILNGIKTYTDLLKESGTNSFRSIVMAYLILTFIYGCDTNGVDDVFLMYVTARPFSWTKSWYSYYLAIRCITYGFSLLVLLPFMLHVFKMSDSTVIILGLLCNVSRYFGVGLSNTSWMIYALLIVWTTALLARPCIWSILSKTVNEHELGKMFINFAIIDTLSKCIGSAVFVYLYSSTVNICPGLVFYVMGGINVLILAARISSKCFRKDEKLSITRIVTQSCECRRPETDVPAQNQSSNELSSTALKEIELTSKHIQNAISSGNSNTKSFKYCSTEKVHLNETSSFKKHKYSSDWPKS
ncbi:proton-coupled folate transporter-like [Ruditapes philippinarum]|uniref:proton-coupled folate transporter-like n=1 Tax=Ruditapes philippinarum TaxID=129788 RepID=UPI00295C2A7A|nr:proton-coupled folate transporter-like [Ruditapes philippinarum]